MMMIRCCVCDFGLDRIGSGRTLRSNFPTWARLGGVFAIPSCCLYAARWWLVVYAMMMIRPF